MTWSQQTLSRFSKWPQSFTLYHLKISTTVYFLSIFRSFYRVLYRAPLSGQQRLEYYELLCFLEIKKHLRRQTNVNILQETRRRQKTWPPYCIFKSGIQSRQILMQIKQRWLCCHFPRINVLFIVIYCFACFDFKFKMKDLRYSEADHHKQCNQIFTAPAFSQITNKAKAKVNGQEKMSHGIIEC